MRYSRDTAIWGEDGNLVTRVRTWRWNRKHPRIFGFAVFTPRARLAWRKRRVEHDRMFHPWWGSRRWVCTDKFRGDPGYRVPFRHKIGLPEYRASDRLDRILYNARFGRVTCARA